MRDSWIWIFAGIIVVVVVASLAIPGIVESYGRQGAPGLPLNIPVPLHANRAPQNMNYVDYSGIDFKTLCPNAGKPPKMCKSRDDCGPAELCFNSAYGVVVPVEDGGISEQPQSNYCSCSIQNGCLELGVC